MGDEMNLAAETAENVDAVSTEEIIGQEGRVEQTVQSEEATDEKVYTEAELNQRVDELLGKKIARREEKIRKEYERKYGELEAVLKAGTGKDNVSEMTQAYREYYESRGVKIPSPVQGQSTRDVEILAREDAAEIIALGLDEVVEEVDRLAKVGVKNMTPREKVTFETLANYRTETERSRELEKIGAAEVAKTQEFKDFASKFSPSTPITEIYEIYNKMQPKKEVTTMGSMKTPPVDNGVKDFYTYEESLKFTKKDFDDNPALYEAVQKSMRLWGKK